MLIFVTIIGLFLFLTGCAKQNTNQAANTAPSSKQTNEIKEDGRDLKIEELQKQIKNKEESIKELQDKISNNEFGTKHLIQEIDNYKRFIDSALGHLSNSQLLEMAKGEWGYNIAIDEKLVPSKGIVELNKNSFKISYEERQISYPPILPVEIHNTGRISGQRFTEHLKVLDYKPSNIIDGIAGTSVEAIVYEFENVPQGTNIKLEISKELKERNRLQTNIITIHIK